MVGVMGDEDMRKVKGTTVMCGAERAEVVRACKYVDEIIEDCPPVLFPEFVAQLHIDYFGCSEESLSMTGLNPYKFLKLQGKAFVIPRTQTISSMDIVTRIIRDRDMFIEQQLNNGVALAQLNI
jgi:choline-phosphate cytidylyltransferase